MRDFAVRFLASGGFISHIPARLTGFKKFTGSGFAGTLLALLLVPLLPEKQTSFALFLLFFLPFSIWIAGMAETSYATHDDPRIVIDEISGYWAAILFMEHTLPNLLCAFILFRILDTLKPWPIKKLETSLSGGFGIIMDDALAGLEANLLTRLATTIPMKLFLGALSLLFLTLPANAQLLGVIPAPSTATASVLSTAADAARQDKAGPSKPAAYDTGKVPLSGIVLMPTAYLGRGKNTIGLGLDINAAYYIGRLYGKNSYYWTIEKKNYLDRVGLWLLSADTKMQIQTEGTWRPAMAAGVQGILQFRDAPQPALNQSVTLSQKLDSKTNSSYANAYIALTKRLHPKFLVNAGYSDGDMPKVIYSLSEFLSKQAINIARNNPDTTATVQIPTGMIFGGFMWLPKKDSPIGMEIMVPQGAPQSPKLINLHLGTLLKLNFEVSYLTYKGGWDLLGMFQFRYNYLPR